MTDKPNIIVLLADEHSPLTLGCYGSPIVRTPNLDALAARGVTFDQAYCQSPVCVPSRLSFLTGQYPWRIGAWNNVSPVPTHRTSLPQALADAGYHTASIGKMHFVSPEQHWGFQHRPYGDFVGQGHQPDPIGFAPRVTILPAGPSEIPEDEQQESIVNRLGIDFLRSYDRPEPFCLWLSYNRPHFPLRVPQRFWDMYWPDNTDLPDLGPDFPDRLHPWIQFHRRFCGVDTWGDAEWREARAGYYASVSFVDDKVGEMLRVVDELGLRGNTIVVYFSDHGEMNGEHGTVRKMTFYEASARVPLIVSYPGVLSAGQRVDDIVELADLFPTLADFAGAPTPNDLDGRSLAPLLTTGSVAGRKGYAISEHYSHGLPGPARMIRLGDWKYILYLDARSSLFNVREDPAEFYDRIDEPGVAQQIAREADRLLREDWDEERARANFVQVLNPAENINRRPTRAPNQYRRPNGELVDAETFYPGVDWAKGPL